MVHANALLTPRGRLALAVCVVEDGWSLRRAAERFQTSPQTAGGGPAGIGIVIGPGRRSRR